MVEFVTPAQAGVQLVRSVRDTGLRPAFDLKVVAEGVETAAHIDRLLEQGTPTSTWGHLSSKKGIQQQQCNQNKENNEHFGSLKAK